MRRNLHYTSRYTALLRKDLFFSPIVLHSLSWRKQERTLLTCSSVLLILSGPNLLLGQEATALSEVCPWSPGSIDFIRIYLIPCKVAEAEVVIAQSCSYSKRLNCMFCQTGHQCPALKASVIRHIALLWILRLKTPFTVMSFLK